MEEKKCCKTKSIQVKVKQEKSSERKLRAQVKEG